LTLARFEPVNFGSLAVSRGRVKELKSINDLYTLIHLEIHAQLHLKMHDTVFTKKPNEWLKEFFFRQPCQTVVMFKTRVEVEQKFTFWIKVL
jgi:hypothetical protein